jgi:hypothetical protein
MRVRVAPAAREAIRVRAAQVSLLIIMVTLAQGAVAGAPVFIIPTILWPDLAALAFLVKGRAARVVIKTHPREAAEVLAERLVAQEPLWVTLSATKAAQVEHMAE